MYQVSIYGRVLSLFVKFSRSKNIKFVYIPIFGKKNRKIRKIEKLREKNVENLGKKNSPIRMTLRTRTHDRQKKHVYPPHVYTLYLVLVSTMTGDHGK